ncbi:MAG: thioether cross-link-forming SCIFF peptide maturase [Oscillospiraceae bacterium]|nr:thioether cross-link-forming SCIFF peptide maturase [Oscillospiraceae bacterium]
MIHQYKLNGYNIVMDIHSGAIHVVDDIVYDIIEKLTPPLADNCPEELYALAYSKEDIDQAYAEVLELYKAEQLFTQDDYARFDKLMTVSPIKSMCLHIAHDCNLRCKYCFADTGSYQGGRSIMTAETGKKAIDFLIKHSYGRRNLEVDFFGGEPLLNFGAVKEIVEYARSKEKEHNKVFRFTLTTNGVLLDDEKIDYINKEMSNIVISCDGRPEVHDRMRPRVDGSGSYNSIMPKFKKLVEKRGDKEYYIRATFTKYNKDFTEDVLHFYNEGFEQISIEPVVTDPKHPYALTEEDLPEVFAEYDRLAAKLIEMRKNGEFFNFFHFMIDLDQGPCAIKRLRGCGCGNEYVAITPDGEVYPCHQFVGNPQWKMGDLDSMEVNLATKETFARSTVYGKDECRECWAKFYCSGGCNAANMQYRGNILKPFKLACDLEKKRVECAIMIQAALAE